MEEARGKAVRKGRAGSGGECPLDLHPSFLQASPLISLVKLWPQTRVGFSQEGQGWGTDPFRTVLVALFGDFVPFPRRPGWDGGGRKFCCILSFFLSSASQSPFCMFLSAWLLVHSSTKTSSEGSQRTGLLRGACRGPWAGGEKG